MKTHNITITEKQLRALQQAVECTYDMENDMLLEDLYISNDDGVITKSQAKEIRNDISRKADTVIALAELKLILK